MDWYEPLPDNCPPEDAYEPQNEKFYRLGKPPIDDNSVISIEAEGRRGNFKNVGDCIARAVSIWGRIENCKKVLMLPSHRDKIVLELTLLPKDGQVKQTMRDPHYSWWRSNEFDILSVRIID
jgi:hypothetical protein